MPEVTPVPASTLALVRDSKQGLEVLMMRRNLHSGFVPGSYVFPGGALEAADHSDDVRSLSTGLSDADASAKLGIAAGGLAYWIAAIRESFEEAGVLVAYDEHKHLVAIEDDAVAARFATHRGALNRNDCGLAEILKSEGLLLAADHLVYFAHWITPVHAPRRYDARFFAAVAPPRQSPSHDARETIAHVWIRPGEALRRAKQDDFKMRMPTVHTLRELAAYDTADALMRALRAKPQVPEILPRFTRNGERLLPGQPGYDDIADAAAQMPWKP